jgi:hypothetical protein
VVEGLLEPPGALEGLREAMTTVCIALGIRQLGARLRHARLNLVHQLQPTQQLVRLLGTGQSSALLALPEQDDRRRSELQRGGSRRVAFSVELDGDRMLVDPLDDAPVAPRRLRHRPACGARCVRDVDQQPPPLARRSAQRSGKRLIDKRPRRRRLGRFVGAISRAYLPPRDAILPAPFGQS